MFETQLELEGRSLVVRALANLWVRAADRTDVWIHLPEGREADVQVESGEAAVEVTLRSSAEVKVPAGTPVRVAEAKGNLALDGLDVAVDVEEVRGNLLGKGLAAVRVASTVHGNLSVKGCGTLDVDEIRGNARLKAVSQDVRVGKVAGNLAAKDLGGGLEGSTIRGNALLRGLDGQARIGRVGGNLAAKELAGGLDVETVGGNVALSGPWTAGQAYRVSAGGNAVVRLEPEASAQVRVMAGGHLLTSVPLRAEEDAPGWRAGATGEGEAELEIRAGGNLVIGGDGHAGAFTGWASLGADLAQDAIEGAMGRLHTKLESVDWDRVGQKAEKAVERALERMERKLGRAMERSERATARAERAHARAERTGQPGTVSREERFRILEQLSASEIDVDEALELLKG
jgi:hypothetical protein